MKYLLWIPFVSAVWAEEMPSRPLSSKMESFRQENKLSLTLPEETDVLEGDIPTPIQRHSLSYERGLGPCFETEELLRFSSVDLLNAQRDRLLRANSIRTALSGGLVEESAALPPTPIKRFSYFTHKRETSREVESSISFVEPVTLINELGEGVVSMDTKEVALTGSLRRLAKSVSFAPEVVCERDLDMSVSGVVSELDSEELNGSFVF